jgi:hypothetical protein
VPAFVAPERFQAQKCFVAALAPKLAGPFEPALGLSAGSFDGTAANGFARAPSCAVIHARLVFLKICYFFGHRLAGSPAGICSSASWSWLMTLTAD